MKSTQQLWVDSGSSKTYLIKTRPSSHSSVEIKQVKLNGDYPVTWDARDFGSKPRELSA